MSLRYLFSVVCDRLQDGTQRLDTDGYVQQVSRKEEVVKVTQHREGKVPGNVQEGLKKRNIM